MTEKLDDFLNVIELHRQRDALEESLRGLIAAFEAYSAASSDLVCQTNFMFEFSRAKLRLLELEKSR